MPDGTPRQGQGHKPQEQHGQHRPGTGGSKIIHCKKGLAVFPSQAGMSLTKLFLGGNNLIVPAQGEFGQ